MSKDEDRPVYQCSRCGACCRWPGDVCLEDDEIEAMAAFLEMDSDLFIEKYCGLRANRQGLSLVEDGYGACIMLENGACRINPVKPRQCRNFPNKWNFPGWRDVCKATLVDRPADESRS